MAQEKDSCAVEIDKVLCDYDTVYASKSKVPETLIDSLVACKNSHCLKEELHRLHNLNRVMYGRMEMILDTKPCYIVVFDYRGDIVAFLEPGDERRLDLMTNKQVMLEEYAYYLKLWLIVY